MPTSFDFNNAKILVSKLQLELLNSKLRSHPLDFFNLRPFQDAHGLHASTNHLTSGATPSPAPSSCNTASMLHTAATQPIYNSSSTGGSSLQLNSSYNYPPSATGYSHASSKFGTLNGPLNGSPNLMLNQSLTNVAPLNSLAPASISSIPTKRVMFVGDTPQSISANAYANAHTDNIQLLPAHSSYPPSAYAPALAQPVYNQDLNVSDVYYGPLQAPMKLPRLNYHMSNSRISLNNSLNNSLTNHQFSGGSYTGNQFANTLANQQAVNQQYQFPVVSSSSKLLFGIEFQFEFSD